MENLLKIKSLSVFLGFTEGALRMMVHRKQLPFIKLGRTVRFRPSDIEAWLRSNAHSPNPPSEYRSVKRTAHSRKETTTIDRLVEQAIAEAEKNG